MNVGIFGLWGINRGHVFVNKNTVDTLLKYKHDVFIYQIRPDKIEKDFEKYNELVHITKGFDNSLSVPEKLFKKWVLEHNLDMVFFNEYNQWSDDGQNLVKTTVDMNVKAYGYLMWERFNDVTPEVYKDYTRLLCPTKSLYRLMRQYKIRNKTYIPYSLDLTEYEFGFQKKPEFTFIHIGGMLGAYHRKNTNAVIEAFKRVNEKHPETRLIVTCQKQVEFPIVENVTYITEDLSREKLMVLLASCHISVLPSKWEGIGLPLLESMALGVPVITVNSPPMNELVIDNKTGLLAGVEKYTEYPDITVMGAEVDINDLANKMITLASNTMIYDILSMNAKKHMKDNFDLEVNEKELMRLIENE